MIFPLSLFAFSPFRLFPCFLTMPAQPPANLSRSLKFLVVGVLYFAEGMPFGFIITSMNAYMAGQGVPRSRSAS